jgi:hypothetical protein
MHPVKVASIAIASPILIRSTSGLVWRIPASLSRKK